MWMKERGLVKRSRLMPGNNNDRQPCVGTMIGQWQGNSVYPDAIPVSWVLMHVSMPATSVFDLFSSQLVPIWGGLGDSKAVFHLMGEYQRRAAQGSSQKLSNLQNTFNEIPHCCWGKYWAINVSLYSVHHHHHVRDIDMARTILIITTLHFGILLTFSSLEFW